ncbi:ABC transporter ATP-binding protein [Neorhizobium sp. NCHU2750]|uniref:ABC transporter ATP-binding protein n=1 Tax=Neorhizobium sp. NCHU2750 TaxID=1825976 RepID=UPI000EB6A968|nr:peptide/nickel ABC transporter ATP-binding protein [Neorhizobium sp. NCHU2750]
MVSLFATMQDGASASAAPRSAGSTTTSSAPVAGAAKDSVALELTDIRISTLAGHDVVRGVSLQVNRGEVLAVIGASGSGKTTLALTALGRLRPGLVFRSGSVRVGGTEIVAAPRGMLNRMRGRVVSYIAQSASASFNPRIRLGRQVTESALLHRSQNRSEADAVARRNFDLLSLPSPEKIAQRFPHEVSGGQLQRFMIAMGMQEQPLMLICDEPTSALDVTTQVEVIAELKRVIKARNTAALFISHDLAVVAQLADRIAVMRDGALVEIGTTEEILEAPREDYTRQLLDACRHFPPAFSGKALQTDESGPPAIVAEDVVAGYGMTRDGEPVVTTLHGTSVAVRRGEVVALIGESGSGKSTFARVIAGLLPSRSGTVTLDGQVLSPAIATRDRDQRRKIQLVYQSADTALNSRQTARQILGRTLTFYQGLKGRRREERTIELLDLVHLSARYLDKKPSEMSGGEKQRLNLARALAADPEVLICDEITSALDTIVAVGITDLIADLSRRLGLAVLYISHDLATVASLADRVVVLKAGRVVETGATETVLTSPEHPYTRLLCSSVPQLRIGWLEEAEAVRRSFETSL